MSYDVLSVSGNSDTSIATSSSGSLFGDAETVKSTELRDYIEAEKARAKTPVPRTVVDVMESVGSEQGALLREIVRLLAENNRKTKELIAQQERLRESLLATNEQLDIVSKSIRRRK